MTLEMGREMGTSTSITSSSLIIKLSCPHHRMFGIFFRLQKTLNYRQTPLSLAAVAHYVIESRQNAATLPHAHFWFSVKVVNLNMLSARFQLIDHLFGRGIFHRSATTLKILYQVEPLLVHVLCKAQWLE